MLQQVRGLPAWAPNQGWRWRYTSVDQQVIVMVSLDSRQRLGIIISRIKTKTEIKGDFLPSCSGSSTSRASTREGLAMEVLVAGQLEKTQSKDSASLSSFMLSHCCLYAIQMSIIMITKEEMWTASMTRQSDTPSFHSAHLPESDAEVFMTSFRTYHVAHWIIIEPSHVLGRWQKSPVSQSSFSSSMANHG